MKTKIILSLSEVKEALVVYQSDLLREVPDSMLRELTNALLRGQNSNQFLELIEKADVSAWIGTPSDTYIGWKNLIEDMPMIFIPVNVVEQIVKDPINYEVELETPEMNYNVSTKKIAKNF